MVDEVRSRFHVQACPDRRQGRGGPSGGRLVGKVGFPDILCVGAGDTWFGDQVQQPHLHIKWQIIIAVPDSCASMGWFGRCW